MNQPPVPAPSVVPTPIGTKNGLTAAITQAAAAEASAEASIAAGKSVFFRPGKPLPAAPRIVPAETVNSGVITKVVGLCVHAGRAALHVILGNGQEGTVELSTADLAPHLSPPTAPVPAKAGTPSIVPIPIGTKEAGAPAHPSVTN